MNMSGIIFTQPRGGEPKICVDCGGRLEYREAHYAKPKAKHFLVCVDCNGHYKATSSGEFMSAPADRHTRRWRAVAHEAFERLTTSPSQLIDYKDLLDRTGRNVQRAMTAYLISHRRHCYHWLAEKMGIPEAHIGLMNIAQCRNVIAICEGVHPEEIVRWHQSKKKPKKRKSRVARCHDFEELD